MRRASAVAKARALVRELKRIHPVEFTYMLHPVTKQALVPLEDFGEQVLEVQRLTKELAGR